MLGKGPFRAEKYEVLSRPIPPCPIKKLTIPKSSAAISDGVGSEPGGGRQGKDASPQHDAMRPIRSQSIVSGSLIDAGTVRIPAVLRALSLSGSVSRKGIR